MKSVTLWRINAQSEHPSPEAEKVWKAVHISGKPSYRECQDFADALEEARIDMVNYGVFDDTPRAYEKEMRELYEEAPLGSTLRLWMSQRPKAVNFDGFMKHSKDYQKEQDRGNVSQKISVAKE